MCGDRASGFVKTERVGVCRQSEWVCEVRASGRVETERDGVKTERVGVWCVKTERDAVIIERKDV